MDRAPIFATEPPGSDACTMRVSAPLPWCRTWSTVSAWHLVSNGSFGVPAEAFAPFLAPFLVPFFFSAASASASSISTSASSRTRCVRSPSLSLVPIISRSSSVNVTGAWFPWSPRSCAAMASNTKVSTPRPAPASTSIMVRRLTPSVFASCDSTTSANTSGASCVTNACNIARSFSASVPIVVSTCRIKSGGVAVSISTSRTTSKPRPPPPPALVRCRLTRSCSARSSRSFRFCVARSSWRRHDSTSSVAPSSCNAVTSSFLYSAISRFSLLDLSAPRSVDRSSFAVDAVADAFASPASPATFAAASSRSAGSAKSV